MLWAHVLAEAAVEGLEGALVLAGPGSGFFGANLVPLAPLADWGCLEPAPGALLLLPAPAQAMY